MISPQKVLVVTTNSLDGLKIQKYLKPVSAHVVAGTNLFSDFGAALTDFFGGRSGTYQRQLSSLYNEAIERLKVAAFEVGANCIVGLKVDMDEISGKSKSMFMITVVGTAVIVENLEQYDKIKPNDYGAGVVSLDKINTLTRKQQIIKDAAVVGWDITDEVWDFITDNQVDEVFVALLLKYNRLAETTVHAESAVNFYKRMLTYINAFAPDKKSELLYLNLLSAKQELTVKTLSLMIRDLQLLDLTFIYNVLSNDDFENKQKALYILAFEKPFYNREDVSDLQRIKQVVQSIFKEQGVRSIKPASLLSKEKAVWTCTCGNVSDDDIANVYCSKCAKDIFGFKRSQLSPAKALEIIDNKISIISYFLR